MGVIVGDERHQGWSRTALQNHRWATGSASSLRADGDGQQGDPGRSGVKMGGSEYHKPRGGGAVVNVPEAVK